jgi:hypothetical protein
VILAAQHMLMSRAGRGSAYTGWLTPGLLNAPETLVRLKDCAARLIDESDAVLCIGIGGPT